MRSLDRPQQFFRLKQLGLAFLIGIFCSTLLSGLGQTKFNQAYASTPIEVGRHWSNHWAAPCMTSLTLQGIFEPSVLESRYPRSAISQIEFATAVLKAFPGAFAANNEYLGLTFEAGSEAAALLMSALGTEARPQRSVARAEALAILVSGSATPYQSRANQLLSATFQDAALIPSSVKEGTAAALAAGYLVKKEPSVLASRWLARNNQALLFPRRSITVADSAAFICRASLSPNTAATVPGDRAVSAASLPATAMPTTELRGVWMTNIDSDVLFSRSALEQALDTLSDLNFNVVYPTVWNWGTTLFPSAVAERTIGYRQGLYPDLDKTGRKVELEAAQGDRDMLREIIELGHSRDLKVMPWFEFGFMAPSDSELARRHPDWLTQKADGTLTTPEGAHDRVWLNPFHPEVQSFLLQLIAELSANYNIDGFQVDDHMGLPFAYGYDPYTVNLYQQEHNGKSPPADAKDFEWTRWRADKITDFMGEVFTTVKTQRPRAVMSVSPNPHAFAYEYYLQDWDTWVKRGYVEELIIQLYRTDLGRFVWEMGQDAAEFARGHIPTAVGVLSGLKARSVPMPVIAEQVEAVRDRGFAGVSFFFYETLWNLSSEGTPSQRQQALTELFSNQAVHPVAR
ncbi:glycoside hydrolase family 10 protein [cf. Phormidesmis sp. LEGE 11477]|uniref:glycoside hydrolase family 10 protein n=1 Tax=cf. Phormidesmis sp. LEGE 11477 TaxID=1828680 RepID=UPI001D13B210|nr:glycoside hydrolase family 10 protein [cf. Phormidesmis sp. LEGE 11477]